ncbi:unnamed protein product [Polarella glacialis]|uniref:Uncharacterized protein n=1 Tax=Polarella glacialis TaxID=89957 RepID=A0A813JK01_POLGL|nr:unnamed protein product [Polarella glacialis]CAE8678502.1 unnamed protein product [Polarella glacialis]CAE8680716.1 unnamed protein product [Polarella glacialis]
MVLALLSWWLRCLYHDAVLGLRRWAREPEWPLLAVAVAFTASFLFHWLGYRLAIQRVGWSAPLFALTEWEGRTGWRKPLVFGISNAMVFVSLREAFAAQQLAPRRLASHLVAWSTALEVGIITLQAWRGVGSHFNTSTTLDASLYGAKLCGAALLGLGCFVAAAGFTLWPAPAVPAAKAVALRHGLWLLCIAVAVGVGQAIYGHHLREARPEEDASCLVASAGVAASPCYEIHGQAIVKLAHFLPLHVTEVLLLLAWATAHVDGVLGARVVRTAAVACWSLAGLGLWLTARGENLKSPSLGAGLILFACLATVLAAFVYVLVAPLRIRIGTQAEKRPDFGRWGVWAANRAAACNG